MNCDLAAELIPWLLNGTLEAGERRELIEHLRGCSACRAALADTQVAWDLFDWHPPAAALVAYAGAVDAGGSRAPVGATVAGERGASSPSGDATAGAGAIEEHLAGCPRCSAELELVRTSRLLADPAEDGRIAILPAPIGARRDDAAARRAWQRSALAASVVGLLAATGWIESARHSREIERRLAATPARAAAPATALRRRADEAEARLSTLADENRQLQQKIDALGRTVTEVSQSSDALQASRPPPGPGIESDLIESDLVVTDVYSTDRVERSAGAPAADAIPVSSGAATLLLHTRHPGSFAKYEIEVRDARGRLVDKPTRVSPAPGGKGSFDEFDITLRRGALHPGAYTLHLFGRPAAGGREALETYSIRVS